MSRAHAYQQPNAPGSPAEESDSDLEIDLHELGPATARGNSFGSGEKRGGDGQRRRHIALRNLQPGRSRRWETGEGTTGFADTSDIGGEDLQGLLPDDAEHEGPVGGHEDEAPLLHQSSDLSSREQDDHGLSKAQGQFTSRNITIGQYPPPRFPPNAVSNAKYTPWSFLPRTLYNEFSFFFNMYFLLVALSQIIPPLRIGYLSTYVAPLAFVLAITLGKEALDDIARRRRDNEANKESYTVLRLRDVSQTGTKAKGRKDKGGRKARRSGLSRGASRLDDIAEEERSVGQTKYDANIQMDEIEIRSRDLKVGDVLRLGKDQRVPADLVILKCYAAEVAAAPDLAQPASDKPTERGEHLIDHDADGSQVQAPASISRELTTDTADTSQLAKTAEGGEAFIRTDQLDGETDWKLRLASPLTQSLDPRSFTRLRIVAGKPEKNVNEFVGTIEYTPYHSSLSSPQNNAQLGAREENSTISAPLTIDNTAWANTVLASNATVLAVVVYTGAQTRQAMSTSPSRSKTGILEYEINNLTKILCALTLTLSIVLVALEGFENHEDHKWYVAITRFLILFSTIIPISLRVNLDMGKTVYAWFIERDQDIPDTVVRTSTIPEELGRIEYLLSDKTGTLTQNGMWKILLLIKSLTDILKKWN